MALNESAAIVALQQAFLALQYTNGNAARDFMEALNGLSQVRAAQFLASPPDEVLRSQGRAQEASQLVTRLAQAREEIEYLEKNKERK